MFYFKYSKKDKNTDTLSKKVSKTDFRYLDSNQAYDSENKTELFSHPTPKL